MNDLWVLLGPVKGVWVLLIPVVIIALLIFAGIVWRHWQAQVEASVGSNDGAGKWPVHALFGAASAIFVVLYLLSAGGPLKDQPQASLYLAIFGALGGFIGPLYMIYIKKFALYANENPRMKYIKYLILPIHTLIIVFSLCFTIMLIISIAFSRILPHLFA